MRVPAASGTGVLRTLPVVGGMLFGVPNILASPVCPHCGQRAPVVLRGLEAHCTACGGRRPPLAPQSLTLTGQPSRIGGTLATLSGALVLLVGLSLATFLGLLLQSIWPGSFVGWAFAIPIAAVTLFVGLGLLFGGRRLKRKGMDARRRVQLDAIRALANHRGGSVTALEAAKALDLPEEECDALLTQLAKDPRENVSLDVDDDGQIHYLFGIPEKRWRVLEETAREAALEADEAEPERPEWRARR